MWLGLQVHWLGKVAPQQAGSSAQHAARPGQLLLQISTPPAMQCAVPMQRAVLRCKLTWRSEKMERSSTRRCLPSDARVLMSWSQ